MSTRSLHGFGGKLFNASRVRDLSEKEEWAWSCIVSELEYRNRRVRPVLRCTCVLCCSPFPEDDESPLDRLERV